MEDSAGDRASHGQCTVMQAARVSTSLRASRGTSWLRRRPVCASLGPLGCLAPTHTHTIADLLDKSNGARVKVVVRTSVYISSIGVVAFIWPGLVMYAVNGMTHPAGAAVVDAVFVRLGGLLAILFGMYYAGAALDDLDGRPPMRLYRSTVIGRGLFALASLVMFAAEMTTALHVWLLVLGAMNAVSALAIHRQLER